MVIDHLVFAAPDLAMAVADLEDRLGVRAEPGGRHLGLGTRNALLALGPATYLEIIAPDPDQPDPAGPRPFGVDDVTQGHLVGWAVSCDDIDEAVSAARAAGYDPGDPIDMTRQGATGPLLRWRLTVNALAGGPVPFLIDWGDTEHPATSAPVGLTLVALRVEHPDPASLAPTLAALGADVEVARAAEPALVARIDGPGGATELR